METLEINVNGSTATKNDFTTNKKIDDIDGGEIQSHRLDFIKVRTDRTQTAKNAGKKTKRHEKKHVTHKRLHRKSLTLKKKNSKESNKRSYIEKGIPNNKQVSQLNDSTSTDLDEGEESDDTQDNETDESEEDEKPSNENLLKKTSVNEPDAKSLPSGRRYTVKGYKDNMAVQPSTLSMMNSAISVKKDKGVPGVKKSGNPVEVKTREEIGM